MESPAGPMDKLKIFYDFSSARFNYLAEIDHNLSSKTIEIFKIIMSITPILLGIGYYLSSITPSSCALTLFKISVVSFFLTIIIGLFILSQKLEGRLTDPYEFYKEYFDSESPDILEQIAVQIGSDYTVLRNRAKTRKDNLTSMLICFMITLGFLFWAFMSIF